MNSGQIRDARIENYLSWLDSALAGVAAAEKEDILLEIRTHIMDTAASAADRDAAVERTLRLLGTPEELAGRYTTESLLTRAGRSFSPWLLLRTCWRWAALGMKGTVAFLLALFGYGTALALTVSVFLKPLMPSRVGLWIGQRSLEVGVPAHPEQMHELLGHWFVPVIAVAAFLAAVGTTQGLRWIIRRRSARLTYETPRAGLLRSASLN